MNYIAYKFTIHPPNPWTEILLAKLSLIEFESFEEKPTGLDAFILKDFDDEDFIKEQISELDSVQISYEKEEIEKINWNQEWEKSFNPIKINQKCLIKADFHDIEEDFEYVINIQPKMSFGTGHHETTHLMVEFILENEFKNKSVLDMGTGTGILAILAKMKEAKEVDAIDIDDWSYQNGIENAEKNNMKVNFLLGGAETIPNKKYDTILANINKNILIADLPFYVNALKNSGELYLSGLYNFDEQDILMVAEKYGLKLAEKKERNEWISLKFHYEKVN